MQRQLLQLTLQEIFRKDFWQLYSADEYGELAITRMFDWSTKIGQLDVSQC